MKRKIDSFPAHAAFVALVLTVALIFAGGAVAETGKVLGYVNINTADSGQLAALPGIGESKARAIVEYRSKHGPFPTVESLADVQGIGMKVLERIRPFITIKQP
jgi:competence ComEA-like helix-hairpin-helix protein